MRQYEPDKCFASANSSHCLPLVLLVGGGGGAVGVGVPIDLLESKSSLMNLMLFGDDVEFGGDRMDADEEPSELWLEFGAGVRHCFVGVDLESHVDAFFAAVFVRRERSARAVAAKENVGACSTVPKNFGRVCVRVGHAHLYNSVAGIRIDLQHSHKSLLT
ncbi:hypothetical protein BpHYR1_006950 [Brachionus plicatilis]|uniref:Uncharacterized protein n=1 Tax=Brachionus plicatilis TaxID=10195 RepID=A0A3M7QIA5_BRAPC|nr:hypothetical protein BpHYR1_006950 [Brachionus plicatilis]